MAEAGLNPEGFIAKTQTEIVDDMEANQKAVISPTFDPDPDSPTGQVNGIVARQVAIVWEGLEEVYHSFDLDSAEGDALDNIGKLKGIPRLGAAPSEVDITFDALTGVTLEPDVHFVESETEPGQLWTPKEVFTALSDAGGIVRTFVSTVTGPTSALAGSITIINTPVSGWSNVINKGDAAVGRNDETDGDYRAVLKGASNNQGVSSIGSISDAVLRVTNVDSVFVYENATPNFDSAGRPPHSFEVIIDDGNPSLVDNDEVAQAIWDKKPAGIQAYGSEQGSATDYFDRAQLVGFSKVQDVALNISAGVEVDGSFQGEEAVINAILTKQTGVGEDVMTSSIVAAIMGVEGVRNATVTANGQTDRVVVAATEKAIFDSSTITLTVSIWQDF